MQEKIQVKFYPNVIIIMCQIILTIITAFLILFCYYLIRLNVLLYIIPAMLILHTIAIIYLSKSFSKQRDLFINNKEIIQNGAAIINKSEIVYLRNNVESKIFISINDKN